MKIRYRVADLIWRPLRRQVRFVAVDHPTRGRTLLLSTDLALDPIDVIRLYGIRFKIELSFKQALRVLGAYAYHFWMMTMKPLPSHRSANQYLHRESDHYRAAVHRKLGVHSLRRSSIAAQRVVAGRLPGICDLPDGDLIQPGGGRPARRGRSSFEGLSSVYNRGGPTPTKMPRIKTFYDELGLARDANAAEIKRAFIEILRWLANA